MIFFALFTISASILALQILQTRIFSFTLWHHLAYMVITVALTGMSVAGTFLAIRKKEVKNSWNFLSVISLLFSISTVFSLAFATRIPLDTFMSNKVLQLGYIFLYYMTLIFPYFFAGIVIAFIFKQIKDNIHIYYLSNLTGSAIGGVLIIPIMEKLGGEATILVVAFMGVFSALLFAFKSKNLKLKITSAVVFLLISLGFINPSKIFPVTAPESKAIGMGRTWDKNQKILYTNWDRVARIDVFENKKSQQFFNYYPELKNKVITIDGDAYTLLYDFPSAIEKIRKQNPKKFNKNNYYANYPRILTSLYSSAYLTFKDEKPKVLVVGLGGGTDIITALANGASSVTGVEINKAMIDVTKNKFAKYIGSPYQNKKVKIIHSEGRSFIRRTKEKYDIIQMSGVDTWTALSSGAYIMSESYIYTTNAINEYMKKLKPNGTLSIMRWLFWPPREMLRLCTEAVQVLRKEGIKNPEKNIVVIGDGSLATILIKKRPFSWYELASIVEQTSKTKDKRVIYAPGFSASKQYYFPIFIKYGKTLSLDDGYKYIKTSFEKFFNAVKNHKEKKFIAKYKYNITPVSDDNPFFFRYYKWEQVFKANWGEGGSFVDSMPIGLIILLSSLVQALILSFLLIVAPLIFMNKKEKAFSPHLQIIYFFMIGVGYMFIEISTIQRFILFLGNPSDAIAITIMFLLFFTGIGALFSKKVLIKLGERTIYKMAIIFFPLFIILYAKLIPFATHFFIDSSFSLRVFISALILAPIGFILGNFFPIGLTIVGEKNASFIPWAFAVNGLASVISSIFAIILAMAYGFNVVFIISAFCYLFASISFLRFSQKHI